MGTCPLVLATHQKRIRVRGIADIRDASYPSTSPPLRHKAFIVALILTLLTSVFGREAAGFQLDVHSEITKEALQKMNIAADALEDIQNSVALVDAPLWGEFSDATAHCDDEELPKCFRRVIDKRKHILNLLKTKAPEGDRAREALGQALHTIQDFYSHSNWVHNPGPNKKSINTDFGFNLPTKLPGNLPMCLEAGVREGNHVLTKYGLTEITTGYFRIGGIPANKCNHGGLIYGGINKDQSNGKDDKLFSEARRLAVLATRTFVVQILQEVHQDKKAIRSLLCKSNANCTFPQD